MTQPAALNSDLNNIASITANSTLLITTRTLLNQIKLSIVNKSVIILGNPLRF